MFDEAQMVHTRISYAVSEVIRMERSPFRMGVDPCWFNEPFADLLYNPFTLRLAWLSP